jgi:hypothetical protein
MNGYGFAYFHYQCQGGTGMPRPCCEIGGSLCDQCAYMFSQLQEK